MLNRYYSLQFHETHASVHDITIMEPIPEVPNSLHLYKLLFHLSANNNVPFIQLALRVPPTLLCGFGFSSPTLMQFNKHRLEFKERVRPEEAVIALEQAYVKTGLPRFILKAKSGKQFPHSRQAALSQFINSAKQGGKRLHRRYSTAAFPALQRRGSHCDRGAVGLEEGSKRETVQTP